MNIDRFRHSSQGKFLIRMFLDKFARFPDLYGFGSVSGARVFEIRLLITSLSSLNDLTVDEQFGCSSIVNCSPDLGLTGKWPLRT